MYRLNEYGKIILHETEVYWGCVTEVNPELQVAKLFVVDWRDKDFPTKSFREIVAPTKDFVIKYPEEFKGVKPNA